MMIINFGKYKGKELSQLPVSYLSWLVNPRVKDGLFNVPPEIQSEAKNLLDNGHYIKDRLSGKGGETTEYVIERLGDIEGLTLHKSYDDAIQALCEEFYEGTDPEDNRILVWEILSSGHKKVVWHCSGWRWDVGEFYELAQGCLPVHKGESLYAFSQREGFEEDENQSR